MTRLAALPPEDVTRLLPQLAPVTWALGDVLYEPDHRMAYLYFPTTAVVSLIYTMLDGTKRVSGSPLPLSLRRGGSIAARRWALSTSARTPCASSFTRG